MLNISRHPHKGQGGHRPREAQKNPSPSGGSPPGSVGWGWEPSSKKTLVRLVGSQSGYCFCPHTAAMSVFWGPNTSMVFTTRAGRVWIREERGEKISPTGPGTSTSRNRRNPFCFYAGVWVLGTRSSACWPVALTLAAPSPHQYTPEALFTLAKQRLRHSSTTCSLATERIPAWKKATPRQQQRSPCLLPTAGWTGEHPRQPFCSRTALGALHHHKSWLGDPKRVSCSTTQKPLEAQVHI